MERRYQYASSNEADINTKKAKGWKYPPWLIVFVLALAFVALAGIYTAFWTRQEQIVISESKQDEYGISVKNTKEEANEVSIGIVASDPNVTAEDLPTVAPMTYLGQIVRAEGEIQEVLSPSAFVLSRNDGARADGNEILVIYRAVDLAGPSQPDEGKHAVVQGELAQFTAETYRSLIEEQLGGLNLERLEGMPTIITVPVAH